MDGADVEGGFAGGEEEGIWGCGGYGVVEEDGGRGGVKVGMGRRECDSAWPKMTVETHRRLPCGAGRRISRPCVDWFELARSRA